jgi:hypothetical protein
MWLGWAEVHRHAQTRAVSPEFERYGRKSAKTINGVYVAELVML